jgi:PKD repeat protein
VLITDDDGAFAAATATVTIHNLAPTADAGGPYDADAGVPVTLDASGSSDPGQDPLSYAWDLDGDGLHDDAAGVSVSHTWADPGSYPVEVRVTDDAGAATTDMATVTVVSATGSAYTTIDLTKQTYARWWRATATVTVALGDQPGGQLLDGAEVSGHWSGVYNSSVTGQTDKNGVVSFRTSFVRTAGELVFSIDTVRNDALMYVLYGESQDSISNGTTSATSDDRSLLVEITASLSSASAESAGPAAIRRSGTPADSSQPLRDTASPHASDTSSTLHDGHNTKYEHALQELLAENELTWSPLELDELNLE